MPSSFLRMGAFCVLLEAENQLDIHCKVTENQERRLYMVRIAKALDLPAIYEIRRQVHRLHCDGRPDIYKIPEHAEKFDQLLSGAFSSDDYLLFVCSTDSSITGYALIRRIVSTGSYMKQDRFYYFIEEFGVKEGCRLHGYGTELMNAITAHAVADNAAAIELDVWAFNESAERFYRKFGMTAKHTFLELPL